MKIDGEGEIMRLKSGSDGTEKGREMEIREQVSNAHLFS